LPCCPSSPTHSILSYFSCITFWTRWPIFPKFGTNSMPCGGHPNSIILFPTTYNNITSGRISNSSIFAIVSNTKLDLPIHTTHSVPSLFKTHYIRATTVYKRTLWSSVSSNTIVIFQDRDILIHPYHINSNLLGCYTVSAGK
jgi:hypothetical protein